MIHRLLQTSTSSKRKLFYSSSYLMYIKINLSADRYKKKTLCSTIFAKNRIHETSICFIVCLSVDPWRDCCFDLHALLRFVHIGKQGWTWRKWSKWILHTDLLYSKSPKRRLNIQVLSVCLPSCLSVSQSVCLS